MSRESDIVLGGIWAVVKAAVSGFDCEVIRGKRRPEGTGSPSVTVSWFTEVRNDSHYAQDRMGLQVVVFEDDADDSGLSETALEIAAAIDEALNGNTIGVPDDDELHGALVISRDGVAVDTEGYDVRSKESFRILRYNAIVE